MYFVYITELGRCWKIDPGCALCICGDVGCFFLSSCQCEKKDPLDVAILDIYCMDIGMPLSMETVEWIDAPGMTCMNSNDDC